MATNNVLTSRNRIIEKKGERGKKGQNPEKKNSFLFFKKYLSCSAFSFHHDTTIEEKKKKKKGKGER